MDNLIWDAPTAHWIATLPTAPSRIVDELYPALVDLGSQMYRVMVGMMPEFEGDMRRDFRILDTVKESDGVRVVLGYTDDTSTIMDPEESLNGPRPFHYPWGKHDGITPHAVLLWNPRTGWARRKLIRWATGIDVGSLNVSRTYEGKSRLMDMIGERSPWVFVSPRHRRFMSETYGRMDREFENVAWRSVEAVWYA